MQHTGSCHCKTVTFSIDADVTSALACNCSHCHIKGLHLVFVPASHCTILSGEDSLATYHFNKNVIDHLFCTTCGVEPFARGKHEGETVIAVNVRCLHDINPDTITLTPYDGKAL